jgi:RecA/RadA recombinase
MADKKKPIEAAAPATDKKKALETAMAQIEKAYGKGSIMRLGENVNMNVEAISTGSLTLDIALGIGGVPKGRIIEIYGPESSGKTTIALHIWPRPRRRAERWRSWTPSTPWIKLRQGPGRQHRQAAHISAGHGRAGFGNHRSPCAFGRVDVIIVDSVAAWCPAPR